MTCHELMAHAPPYVDGELGVEETAAARAHLGACGACRRVVEREYQFRQLLRRQPRESAPPELRARILAGCRWEVRRGRLARWAITPALSAAAAALVVLTLAPASRQPAALVGELVATHAAYADIEGAAEFASTEPRAVERWFEARAGLRATVADYSGAGIRLIGARLATVDARKAAFVLYEKGHTLVSVFMVPVAGAEPALGGRRVAYRGHEFAVEERKGYRTVTWTEGHAVFSFVSMLEYDALLECADSLRTERASRSRL